MGTARRLSQGARQAQCRGEVPYARVARRAGHLTHLGHGGPLPSPTHTAMVVLLTGSLSVDPDVQGSFLRSRRFALTYVGL